MFVIRVAYPSAGRSGRAPSGFAENALDLADSGPIDLGDLGNRHAVFREGADARELRPWDFACCRRLGADRRFEHLVTNRRRSFLL